MGTLKVTFEIPEPFSVELQLMAVLNSAILHFTIEAEPGRSLSPESVARAVEWIHAKWSPSCFRAPVAGADLDNRVDRMTAIANERGE